MHYLILLFQQSPSCCLSASHFANHLHPIYSFHAFISDKIVSAVLCGGPAATLSKWFSKCGKTEVMKNRKTHITKRDEDGAGKIRAAPTQLKYSLVLSTSFVRIHKNAVKTVIINCSSGITPNTKKSVFLKDNTFLFLKYRIYTIQ